ncbi:MAG: hypothetical protein GX102_04575, partial [Porphyromonadaceae bacterium]|nr:hypothetical protein [Porphyromonadaceae bacterium]
ISMLNPDKTTISSLGSFVSQSSQMVSDAVHKEVLAHVPDGSLAQKILMGTQKTYSDRQLWAISYELQKNKKYTQKLGKELAARKAKAELKKQASRSKLQANKAGSQRILDSIKSNGFKLGDYYNWLKKNKKYRKEFYNKKYSSESAKEFMKS